MTIDVLAVWMIPHAAQLSVPRKFVRIPKTDDSPFNMHASSLTRRSIASIHSFCGKHIVKLAPSASSIIGYPHHEWWSYLIIAPRGRRRLHARVAGVFNCRAGLINPTANSQAHFDGKSQPIRDNCSANEPRAYITRPWRERAGACAEGWAEPINDIDRRFR